jgi:hypothetical protein
MTRPLTIAGKPSRELHAASIVGAYSMQPVRGLDKPETIPHIAATQPAAPVGYAWPHLQAPARSIRSRIDPKAPCYFASGADAE